MNISQIFKDIFPIEISKLIQSYLVNDEINKIDKKTILICRECGKEYFGERSKLEENNNLCPCYISWLYFSRDFENPWI